jgi:crotonobetainyl-CoA:carnitine CoA-transferase CaiB-like acyl-CoA transferase
MHLDSIRVLELGRLGPGTYATQLLAEMGADVIKIEHTGGEDFRRTQPAVFDALNRGKRSVELDLTTETGLAAFFDLARDVEVVLEIFRPGVVEQLGVGYDDVVDHNPDIVYCSISGFGENGPASGRAGHNINYEAFSGLMDLTRPDSDTRPSITGFPVGDMAAGVFAALSIVGQLLGQELGSESTGGYVEVAIIDSLISFACPIVAEVLAGEEPRPGRTLLTGLYPCYNVYETSDGRYVTLAAFESKFWENFCRAIDREDLIESHLSDDDAVREALEWELRETFRQRSLAEWEDHLGDLDVMFSPVYRLSETLEHPQLDARQGPEPDTRVPPLEFLSAAGDADRAADSPALGEHTDSILRDLGWDDDAIADLRAENKS